MNFGGFGVVLLVAVNSVDCAGCLIGAGGFGGCVVMLCVTF